ncbi:MAG TPA: transglutaminase domain-containing protein [Chthonomonadaceae bacterium]|nr:transglutaminase domain-containing protein [Chthonomonadaceae bacterium]
MPSPDLATTPMPENTAGPAGASAPNESEPVSPWLYLAGMLVTLSGLYAVNFNIEDRNFTLLTYGLAIGGYLTSYILRICRLPLRALQLPLVGVFLYLIVASLTSDRGVGWLMPSEADGDRAKSLQLVFAWLAILHTYTLTADANILFACVPCMTMIALVSTTTTEPQIQNAFLLFICAATFLMIHENYLRTRTAAVLGRTPDRDRRLFGGQVQLAAFCFFCALILANIVAVPIRTVGQRLFIPTTLSPMPISRTKPNESPSATVQVQERGVVELATGPNTESDVELLHVRSDRGLYWRGATFDYYTGNSFENHTGTFDPAMPAEEADADREQRLTDFVGSGSRRDSVAQVQRRVASGYPTVAAPHRFRIPNSPLELTPAQMRGSTSCVQEVTIVGGLFTQFYGAGNVTEVQIPFTSLQVNPARTLMVQETLPFHSTYTVLSQIADDNPDHLRAAPAGSIPAPIAHYYLQVANARGQENPRLRQLAHLITQGLQTNYDKVVAIQRYIAEHCKYNLQAPAIPRSEDTVSYFLFKSQQGYCDAFGAAMTMLCRYAGIPARLASGFLSGDLENEVYVVRQKHKHLWTEVFFPRIGWVPFDATEGAEDISDHSGSEKNKSSFLAWLTSHGALPPLVGLLILSALAYILKTEVWDRFWGGRSVEGGLIDRPVTNLEIIRLYLAACNRLSQRGLARSPAMTPDEFVRFVSEAADETLPGLAGALERLTTLCVRFRYGPEVATEEDVQSAREAAATLGEVLANARRTRRALESVT